VWGWDDGSGPPVAHAGTGTPLPWREAVLMPAAEQLIHLARLFDALSWRRLRPAPELLAAQPGHHTADRFIAAARTEEGDTALVYLPEERSVILRPGLLREGLNACWYNPRSGERSPTAAQTSAEGMRFETPAPGDWVLLVE
jgi:hypothetical protein